MDRNYNCSMNGSCPNLFKRIKLDESVGQLSDEQFVEYNYIFAEEREKLIDKINDLKKAAELTKEKQVILEKLQIVKDARIWREFALTVEYEIKKEYLKLFMNTPYEEKIVGKFAILVDNEITWKPLSIKFELSLTSFENWLQKLFTVLNQNPEYSNLVESIKIKKTKVDQLRESFCKDLWIYKQDMNQLAHEMALDGKTVASNEKISNECDQEKNIYQSLEELLKRFHDFHEKDDLCSGKDQKFRRKRIEQRKKELRLISFLRDCRENKNKSILVGDELDQETLL